MTVIDKQLTLIEPALLPVFSFVGEIHGYKTSFTGGTCKTIERARIRGEQMRSALMYPL
jgi:hypothetical protein